MNWATTRNNKSLLLKDIPYLSIKELRHEIIKKWHESIRPVAFFGVQKENIVTLFAVLADDDNSRLLISCADIEKSGSYESITPEVPAIHLFERELFEDFGITPLNHPWLKPVRHSNEIKSRNYKLADYPFFVEKGEEIHEVGVGPVHAGVIEPGHFRFLCDGETVDHLEIQLGYQHRGVEELFLKGDIRNKSVLAESLCGDSSIAHSLCYAGVVESLAGVQVSRRTDAIRGIMLELERIGIHIGDLSAIANDIGYLTGNNIFAALRTYIINTSLAVCGSRLGRGMVCPGGINFDIDDKKIKLIKGNLSKVMDTYKLMAEAMFNASGVINRLEKTGIVGTKSAHDLGFIGVAGRASGIKKDVRADHPFGIYRYIPLHPRTMLSGDVYARSYVRHLEILQSYQYIMQIFDNFPQDAGIKRGVDPITTSSISISMTESWRGETLHAAVSDSSGKIIRYKIKDPSFHNWFALALAVRKNGISDFPLCNKSFNLSYCGFDL